jgi:hypothetical protein
MEAVFSKFLAYIQSETLCVELKSALSSQWKDTQGTSMQEIDDFKINVRIEPIVS